MEYCGLSADCAPVSVRSRLHSGVHLAFVCPFGLTLALSDQDARCLGDVRRLRLSRSGGFRKERITMRYLVPVMNRWQPIDSDPLEALS